MRLPVYERFVEKAIEYLRQDQRLTGLLAGGSMVYGAMDEYSDLDLIIVYRNEFQSEIMEQRILSLTLIRNGLRTVFGYGFITEQRN